MVGACLSVEYPPTSSGSYVFGTLSRALSNCDSFLGRLSLIYSFTLWLSGLGRLSLSMHLLPVQLVTEFECILNISMEGVMGVATHTLF